MLLCTGKKLHFTDDQCIRFQKNVGDVKYFFYLDKYMYEQAVVLKERFNSASTLSEKLGVGTLNNVYNSMKAFRDNVPEDLAMFSPFIGLLAKIMEREITDVVTQCGYLHQLARAIDFVAYASTTTDIQRSITKTLSYLDDYQESYDNIVAKYTMDSVEYESVSLKVVKEVLGEILVSNGGSMIVSNNPSGVHDTVAEEEVENKFIVNPNDPFAAFAALAAEFEEEESQDLELAEAVKSTEEVSKEESVEETEGEEEVSKEEQILEKLLRKLGGV